MLSINEFKKILNEYNTELTNEEIIELRDYIYFMADIAIAAVESKNSKKEENQTAIED